MEDSWLGGLESVALEDLDADIPVIVLFGLVKY